MTASDGLRAEDDFDRVEEGIELGRLREDMRGDADALDSAGDANVAGGTLVGNALQIARSS